MSDSVLGANDNKMNVTLLTRTSVQKQTKHTQMVSPCGTEKKENAVFTAEIRAVWGWMVVVVLLLSRV